MKKYIIRWTESVDYALETEADSAAEAIARFEAGELGHLKAEETYSRIETDSIEITACDAPRSALVVDMERSRMSDFDWLAQGAHAALDALARHLEETAPDETFVADVANLRASLVEICESCGLVQG